MRETGLKRGYDVIVILIYTERAGFYPNRNLLIGYISFYHRAQNMFA
jgi:hypothetical protein